MAWLLYIDPIETNGTTRSAKYLKSRSGTGTIEAAYSLMPFGNEPWGLLAADLTSQQDTDLMANADVSSIPLTFDSNLTAGQVTAVVNKLETINVPAGWVNTGITWRQLLRTVMGLFQFSQRFAGITGKEIFQAGVNLSLQFNQLSAANRQALIDTANTFGYDTSSLSGTSTLRQILKTMADQWGSKPLTLGPFSV